MLIGPGGDESINQRFTKQRRSVPFRPTGFGTDVCGRIQAHFAASCVPLRSVPSACFAGGFAGRRERTGPWWRHDFRKSGNHLLLLRMRRSFCHRTGTWRWRCSAAFWLIPLWCQWWL